MSELRQLQQAFFGHLLGQPSDIASAIQSTPQRSAIDRLSIYTTGYRLRLKEALTTDFDQLYSYMGDELFDQLMDAYIDTYTSENTSLRYYSQHMLELLSTQQPFCNYVELLELAKIELAFNHSFDAANCTPFNAQALTQIEAEDWESLCIHFHSSLQIIDLTRNSFPIWKALSEQQTPPESIEEPSTWVIWRKDLISRYKRIDAIEADILKHAVNANNFSQLCTEMANYHPEDQAPVQIINLLQLWISEHWICNLA